MDAQILRAMIEGVERRVEQGFDALNVRISEKNARDSERHTENVSRLATIEADVKAVENKANTIEQKVERINGTVGRHELDIKTLFTRRLPHTGSLTLADLKWYIACFVGGCSVMWALLNLIWRSQ